MPCILHVSSEIRASEWTLISHGAGGFRETVGHNVVGSCVSYLKGLNVTRLLLTIILPSVPPLIILRKEPRLTSSLISQPGSWRRQTFYPCPIRQRSGAALNSLISPPSRRQGEVRGASLSPRQKRGKVLFSKSPLTRAEMLAQALLRRQANILNKRWSRDRLSRPYIRFKFLKHAVVGRHVIKSVFHQKATFSHVVRSFVACQLHEEADASVADQPCRLVFVHFSCQAGFSVRFNIRLVFLK